jgi:hypothetical protein
MPRVFVRDLDPRLKDEGPFFRVFDRFFLSYRILTPTLTLIRKFAFGIIGAFIMGMMNEVIVYGRRIVQKDLIAYKQPQAPGQYYTKTEADKQSQVSLVLCCVVLSRLLFCHVLSCLIRCRCRRRCRRHCHCLVLSCLYRIGSCQTLVQKNDSTETTCCGSNEDEYSVELLPSYQQTQNRKVDPSHQQQQQRKDDLTTTVALKLFMTFLYTLQVLFCILLVPFCLGCGVGLIDLFFFFSLSSLFCWSCTSYVWSALSLLRWPMAMRSCSLSCRTGTSSCCPRFSGWR